MNQYRFLSYSKLNLCLLVFSRHKSNYHPIISIFQTISLHDKIIIQKNINHNDINITANITALSDPNENILTKLTSHFKSAINTGLDITIEKNIPMGAGLGGGSSNAAGFLIALNKLYNLNLTENELMSIGAKYGADIPFFIKGGRSLVTGYGEEIKPLPKTTRSFFVIINPGIHMSTKAIYTAFDNQENIKNEPNINLLKSVEETNLGDNDLKAVAISLSPELKSMESKLMQLVNKEIYMTGSGSTLFIPVASEEEGAMTVKKCKTIYPNYLIQCVYSTDTGSDCV